MSNREDPQAYDNLHTRRLLKMGAVVGSVVALAGAGDVIVSDLDSSAPHPVPAHVAPPHHEQQVMHGQGRQIENPYLTGLPQFTPPPKQTNPLP